MVHFFFLKLLNVLFYISRVVREHPLFRHTSSRVSFAAKIISFFCTNRWASLISESKSRLMHLHKAWKYQEFFRFSRHSAEFTLRFDNKSREKAPSCESQRVPFHIATMKVGGGIPLYPHSSFF
jgi:hypothetical protein